MKGGYSNMILNFIRGFCMALADSVPGVSGGTVAFLLGFYDKFIGSLDALVAGSMQEKKEAIIFFAFLHASSSSNSSMMSKIYLNPFKFAGIPISIKISCTRSLITLLLSTNW